MFHIVEAVQSRTSEAGMEIDLNMGKRCLIAERSEALEAYGDGDRPVTPESVYGSSASPMGREPKPGNFDLDCS